LKPKLSADQVVAAVCDEFDCNTDLILQKGRKKNVVRDVAIYLSRGFTGESGVDLGKYFGNISGAGITVMYNHLAKRIQLNHKLRGRIKRIKNKIINNKDANPFFLHHQVITNTLFHSTFIGLQL
jgi:chromosomal replication initiation ATPase DnaA